MRAAKAGESSLAALTTATWTSLSQASASRRAPDVGVETVTSFEVLEVLRGAAPASVDVALPGGLLEGGAGVRFYGQPLAAEVGHGSYRAIGSDALHSPPAHLGPPERGRRFPGRRGALHDPRRGG